ncbi:MAG TPA: lactate utilization protein [Bryobacteraceae bacterium]|nr:lactate utilization protein [Bryobacteraceae bacterium]
MTAREQILTGIRTALGRTGSASSLPAPLVAPLLRDPQLGRNLYIQVFAQNLEKLSGKVFVVPDGGAVPGALRELLRGKNAVASNAPFLKSCGVIGFEQVRSGFADREALRDSCASADIGITSADYALAETGTLVMLASPAEARLISLLPPVHVAVIPQSRILANLDELLATIPKPAEQTSSMVLITGPSRTADIEQILIRGVHGPGELYAVVVESL